MREIKFRAWDKDIMHSKMVMRSYEEIKNNSLRYVTDNETFNDRVIMQYTGLKDKNGVEIYEGDIIEFTDKWEWYRGSYAIEMMFADEKGKIKLKKKYDAEPMYRFEVEFDPFDGYNMSGSDLVNGYYEVIGNVYENPELLEETKMKETKKQKYYLLSWKQQNIISWEEQTHEDIFDDKETAKAFAKVGKDIFGEYDHQITEIGKKEAEAIIAEQKAKKVKELERLKRLIAEDK